MNYKVYPTDFILVTLTLEDARRLSALLLAITKRPLSERETVIPCEYNIDDLIQIGCSLRENANYLGEMEAFPFPMQSQQAEMIYNVLLLAFRDGQHCALGNILPEGSTIEDFIHLRDHFEEISESYPSMDVD